jgi:hypothetical protein
MSERRGSRQRARESIDLAIKQLREGAALCKAVGREDVGKAMVAALGPDMTVGGMRQFGKCRRCVITRCPTIRTRRYP